MLGETENANILGYGCGSGDFIRHFLRSIFLVITCFLFTGCSSDSSIPRKPFYFTRHGQTDSNLKHVVMGCIDIPLNETGREQARNAAELLKKYPIEYIVSSPLSRALETAKIIAETLHKPIIVMDAFHECNWGVMQGQKDNDDFYAEWLNGKTPEGAESIEILDERVKLALLQALEFPSTILIVSHGDVYESMKRILAQPNSAPIKNCAPVYCEPEKYEAWSIKAL